MTTINFRAKNPSLLDTSILIELLRLMKPRVMSLVIFTCAVGLLTAPGEVSFIKSIIDELNINQLEQLNKLVNLEDENLISIKKNQSSTHFKGSFIIEKFIKFDL